jgi:hypothetical protein
MMNRLSQHTNSRSKLLFLVLFAIIFIFASCDNAHHKDPSVINSTGTDKRSGSVIKATSPAGDEIKLAIPRGAMAGNETLTITFSSTEESERPAFTIEPSGITFLEPVLIAIEFSDPELITDSVILTTSAKGLKNLPVKQSCKNKIINALIYTSGTLSIEKIDKDLMYNQAATLCQYFQKNNCWQESKILFDALFTYKTLMETIGETELVVQCRQKASLLIDRDVQNFLDLSDSLENDSPVFLNALQKYKTMALLCGNPNENAQMLEKKIQEYLQTAL